MGAILTSAAGLVGWGCAGPLAATILVGRSGPVPSLRWLAVAVLGWLLAATIASLGRERGHAGRGRALVLLAIGVPLLPMLYLDDGAYHHVAGGALAGRGVVVYLLALSLVGALWQRAAPALPGSAPPLPSGVPSSGVPPPDAPHLGYAAGYPLLAVTVMLAANYGVFGPLQAGVPLSTETMVVLGVNLALAALAAAAGVWAWGGPALGAVAIWAAWLAFAPWREQLAIDIRAGAALALGAAGVALLVRRRHLPAGAALGALGVLIPPALAALPALAGMGRWRSAAAGLVTVGACLAAGAALPAAWFLPPWDLSATGGTASTITAPPVDGWGPWPPLWGPAGRALWGSPHLQNAALGAFHARLFLGPETLAATIAPPVSPAALALTLGALTIGTWLTGRVMWSLRLAAPRTAATAAVLAMIVGLLLAGTTPRHSLAPAMLALLPLASPSLWRWPGAAGRLALGTAGYLLAGTSVPALATAGAPILAHWPVLASPPALGLALLVAALALLVRGGELGLSDGGDGRDARCLPRREPGGHQGGGAGEQHRQEQLLPGDDHL